MNIVLKYKQTFARRVCYALIQINLNLLNIYDRDRVRERERSLLLDIYQTRAKSKSSDIRVVRKFNKEVVSQTGKFSLIKIRSLQ